MDDLYDDVTLAALERYGCAPPVAAPVVAEGWRGRVGGAAVWTSVMLGVRDVIEPERREPIVEEVDLIGTRWPHAPLDVDFVPGAPRLTRCRVRPWLLRA